MILTDLFESHHACPECGGPAFSDLILAEKKDACYYKVKASAKVWPSAYASGRLVQCRKKGAANYGKSKNEGVAEGSLEEVDRRGFLKGMGAAAVAGAAGGALAQSKPADISAELARMTKDDHRIQHNKDVNELARAIYERMVAERGQPMDRRQQQQWLEIARLKAEERFSQYAPGKPSTTKPSAGFPSQPSEYRRSRNLDNFESVDQGVAEGEVKQFPKKHRGDLEDTHSCVKCGGDLQGGTYMGHKVKVCIPCKQVYLPPNTGIDQRGNKVDEQGVAEGSEEGNLYAIAIQRYPQLKQVDRETVINALNNAYEDYLMHYGYEGIGPDEESSMIDYAVKGSKQGVAEGAKEDMSKEAKAMASGKCPHCHGPVEKKEHPTLTQYHCAKCGIRASIDKQGVAEDQLDEKCRDTHRQVGMKKKGNRMVPDCRPKKSVEESTGHNYAEQLAQQVFNHNPNIKDENQVMNLGYSMAKSDLGRRAQGIFRSEDFPSDFVSAYFYLQRQGMAEGQLEEKSVSQAQFRTMAAAAHNPKFAKKVGIKQSVAKEFHGADKHSNYKKLPDRATEGEQQKGADYRDPKEVNYDDDYHAMVSRVKKLAGVGPMKTVYDPQKRVYRNVPTAVQPKR